MSKQIDEIKRIDNRCCELYDIWLFLEGLKDQKIKNYGISEKELKEAQIFRLNKEYYNAKVR